MLKEPPRDALKGKGATLRAHPNELIAQAPRGSVLVTNCQTWHAGTRNSLDSRLGLHLAFFERQPNKVANLAPVPRMMVEKLYTGQELDALGLKVVDQEEYEKWQQLKKAGEWAEFDQHSWDCNDITAGAKL